MTFLPRRFMHQAWEEFRRDIRSTQWNGVLVRKFLLVLPILIWAIGLGALPFVQTLFMPLSFGFACTPDNQFDLEPSRYRPWRTAGFFQINLVFGKLSFDNAKLIDIIWDVTFGRGGQVLLALCSWHVFRQYVTASMETAPVTYHSYRTVFLENGSSFSSIVLLTRDFIWRRGLRSKLSMIFIVFTMAFTLCFPTLASAMTGYTSIVEAYVKDRQNGNWIRFDEFLKVLYIIHDGDRIGQTKDYFVVSNMTDLYGDPTLGYTREYYECPSMKSGSGADFWNETGYDYMTPQSKHDCLWRYYVSQYVKQYGFNGISQEESVFMNRSLPAPVLNISASYFYDPNAYGLAAYFNETDQKKTLWMWANETYDYEYLRQNGQCQSSGKYYQWGFSWIQLMCMEVILLIWTVGIITLWWRARILMQKQGRATVAGTHKAVIELAAEMSKELDLNTLDYNMPSEEQILKRITASQGGRIAYSPLIMAENQLPDTSLWRWLRHNFWWLFASCVFVPVSASIWTLDVLFCFWTVGPTIGLLFALGLGTTHKSKSIFVLAWTILSSIPILFIAVIMAKEGRLTPFGGKDETSPFSNGSQ